MPTPSRRPRPRAPVTQHVDAAAPEHELRPGHVPGRQRAEHEDHRGRDRDPWREPFGDGLGPEQLPDDLAEHPDGHPEECVDRAGARSTPRTRLQRRPPHARSDGTPQRRPPQRARRSGVPRPPPLRASGSGPGRRDRVPPTRATPRWARRRTSGQPTGSPSRRRSRAAAVVRARPHPGHDPSVPRLAVSSTQTVATTYPTPDCHRPRSSGFQASMNHRNEPSDALYRDISIMSTAIGTVTPNVRAPPTSGRGGGEPAAPAPTRSPRPGPDPIATPRAPSW